MKQKCRFCKGKKLKLFLKRKQERNLVECQDCGLVFAAPFPTKRGIAEIYSEEMFVKKDPKDRTKAGFDNYLKQEAFKRGMFKKIIPWIKKYKSQGELLEVGCAVGVFLEEAKKAGFKVQGLDITDFAVNYCHKRGLKKVYKGTLEENRKRFSSSSFDIVMALQVMEHMGDPQSFLKEVSRVLRPQGILIAAVPDRKSMIARVLGKRWFGYYHYQHLFNFERKTLRNFLEKSGFEILEWRGNRPVWFLTKIVLDSIEHYYGNTRISALIDSSWVLLRFLNITRLPVLLGSMWVVAKKKNED